MKAEVVTMIVDDYCREQGGLQAVYLTPDFCHAVNDSHGHKGGLKTPRCYKGKE